ncbi:hypothetical protein [Nocardia salmonicida]|uniref:hypothetical protein n=1 Tax=Nocardia salmonicida TaxID=53431 RepID=UPI0033F95EBD
MSDLFGGQFEEFADSFVGLAEVADSCDGLGLLRIPPSDFRGVLALDLFYPRA